MKKIKYLLILCLVITGRVVAQSPADKVLGVWLSEEKDGKIEVYKSGNLYYGKLFWLKNMYEADGKTLRKDEKNSNQSLRSRPLKDLVLLNGFKFDDGEWNGGTIYDPKSGKTYSCRIKFKDSNTLDIRGYVGMSMFGRTTIWTRSEK